MAPKVRAAGPVPERCTVRRQFGEYVALPALKFDRAGLP